MSNEKAKATWPKNSAVGLLSEGFSGFSAFTATAS
jgi:hypothetical protein